MIDADAMARRIVEPGRKAWKAIRSLKYIIIFIFRVSTLVWIFVFMFVDNMKTFAVTLFLRAEFGQCVFHDNGELNRAALRTIIFEVEYLT